MVNKGMTMAGLSAMTVGVLALIVIYTIVPLAGSQLDLAVEIPGDIYSTGTFTFTSNGTCGDMVNVTNASGQIARFYINLTTGCSDAPGLASQINVSATDTIVGVGQALSAAMNANDTVNDEMAATNGSAGVVILTYSTYTSTGNNVITAESVTNGSWAASTLRGGQIGSQWNATKNTAIPTAPDLWESIGGIIKVAGVIVVVGGFLTTLKGLRS